MTRDRERIAKSHRNQRHFDAYLDLGFGWGRVYAGVYASTAMYMIEELRKDDLLLREPTHEEMLELAAIIYQNRLQHTVDKRIRRIESFDAVLVFLQEEGITDLSERMAYLLIGDVWDYFPRDDRKFGVRLRIGPGVRWSYYSDSRSTDEYRRDLITSVPTDDPGNPVSSSFTYLIYDHHYRSSDVLSSDIVAQAEYYRPLTRKWQLDLLMSGRYRLHAYETEEMEYTEWRRRDGQSDTYYHRERNDIDGGDDCVVTVGSTATYIVNSRTQLLLRASLYHRYTEALERSLYEYHGEDTYDRRRVDQCSTRVGINGRLDYRISIPTTLRLTVAFDHIDDDYANGMERDLDRDLYTVSASISHYIY